MQQVILIGLNELNIEMIQRYAEAGHLPNFSRILKNHGLTRTESEHTYENIEPWIQWVSIHTGLSYREHGVFRLGDIAETPHPQLWEVIEELTGDATVAVCPMNARNNIRHKGSVFLPDPWTDTPVTGPGMAKRLSRAISRFVNNNAGGGLGIGEYAALIVGGVRYSSLGALARYAQLALTSRRASWRKALLLDLFLGELLCFFLKKRKPVFASIFLNAAAHVQHHYMLSSPLVEGKNPSWYIGNGYDPLLEAYQTYDRIVGKIAEENPSARLMIATGLHQDPCNTPIYYWRPTDHARLMDKLGISYQRILPRMSRDFLLELKSSNEAEAVAKQLTSITVNGTAPLFRIDLRQATLFVEVIYSSDLKPKDTLQSADGRLLLDEARKEFSFVAIKNGVHNQEGYLVDTGAPTNGQQRNMPVQDIYREILNTYASASQP